MEAPQIVMIVFVVIAISTQAARVKDNSSQVYFIGVSIRYAIICSILYWGGFWS